MLNDSGLSPVTHSTNASINVRGVVGYVTFSAGISAALIFAHILRFPPMSGAGLSEIVLISNFEPVIGY